VRSAVESHIHRFTEKKGDDIGVFPVRESYDELVSFLTCGQFPFNRAIAASANKFFELEPKLFIGLLSDMILSICDYLEVNRDGIRTLTLTIYRIVFDSIGARSDPWLSHNNLLQSVADVPLRELKLGPQFCPPDMDVRETPRALFRRDPLYGLAVAQLESACFHTNPFDILDGVHRAVRLTEAAATVYSCQNAPSFTFELSFVFFLAVLLASDLPELDAIAQFVDAYTPGPKIGALLENAKSDIVAGALYCQDLITKHRSRRGSLT
jgi:hypothetical protein